MYDRRFFRSKVGRAAMLSVAAMGAMNIVAWRGPATPAAVDSAERLAVGQA